MEIRKQVAKPCSKKGVDNSRFTSTCECSQTCVTSNHYYSSESTGTKQHLKNSSSEFKGCLEIEEHLIEQKLLRYESREDGGLEVVFEGIESLQNLNSEMFDFDYLGVSDQLNTGELDDLVHDSIKNNLFDSLYNDTSRSKGKFTDESLRQFMPDALGLAKSSCYDLFRPPPKDLYESFFITLYARGEFNKSTDDVRDLAACLIHGVDTPVEMKKVWPRYSEARYLRFSKIIREKVNSKMPTWAKKFDQIWDKLTAAQAEALRMEWFYDSDEKPTQAENAKKLGISITSYQERLQLAYQKIKKHYPEFTLRKRKNPVPDLKAKPLPLYLVNLDGSRVEIPHTQAKQRILSWEEKAKIKKLLGQSMPYFPWEHSYDQYDDEDDDSIETDSNSEEDEDVKYIKDDQEENFVQ